MNNIIKEIEREGIVRDEEGNEYKLNSHIDKVEGNVLFKLIDSDPTITKTLEVGCAYGISSLYICSAISERDSKSHTIIDPFQYEHWHGVGISNLKRAGFDFYNLIEKPSEFALPELLQKESGVFDVVFIDGWHTFDHTLLDLFYANRLIKVGGYLVVDDSQWSSVAKAVSYFFNYPAYKLLTIDNKRPDKKTLKGKIGNVIKTVIRPSVAKNIIPVNLYNKYYIRLMFSSMVILKKIEEDNRNWDWFKSF